MKTSIIAIIYQENPVMSPYEEILSVFEKLRLTGEKLYTCSQLIDLFPLISKVEQKEIANRFYQLVQQTDDRNSCLHRYSKCLQCLHYFYSEEHEYFLPLATETQKLFEEQGDHIGLGVCLTIIGSTYRTLGNMDLALNALWQAYDYLNKSDKHLHFQMACSFQIASIYAELNQSEEALPLFRHTQEMAEREHNYFWQIYALHGLGKLCLREQRNDEAKEFLSKAMDVSEQHCNPVSICNSLTELANYYTAVNDLEQAELLIKRSLRVREENKFIGGAITNCIQLGELYNKQSDFDQSIPVLEKGLTMANQIKVKPKIVQIHLLLSKIYETKNDLTKSLEYYKLYHETREQVEVEDSAKRLKNAALIFEAGQTQKENLIIKKQKKEIVAKNIELQHTIDELTKAKIGKKAKALTLMFAIVFFIFEDSILHFALHALSTNNYFLSLAVKMIIIFSLSPINKAIEKYLLKKVVRNKNIGETYSLMETEDTFQGRNSFLPFGVKKVQEG